MAPPPLPNILPLVQPKTPQRSKASAPSSRAVSVPAATGGFVNPQTIVPASRSGVAGASNRAASVGGFSQSARAEAPAGVVNRGASAPPGQSAATHADAAQRPRFGSMAPTTTHKRSASRPLEPGDLDGTGQAKRPRTTTDEMSELQRKVEKLTTDYNTVNGVVQGLVVLVREQKDKIADLESKGATAATEKKELEARVAHLEGIVKQLSLVQPDLADAKTDRDNLLSGIMRAVIYHCMGINSNDRLPDPLPQGCWTDPDPEDENGTQLLRPRWKDGAPANRKLWYDSYVKVLRAKAGEIHDAPIPDGFLATYKDTDIKNRISRTLLKNLKDKWLVQQKSKDEQEHLTWRNKIDARKRARAKLLLDSGIIDLLPKEYREPALAWIFEWQAQSSEESDGPPSEDDEPSADETTEETETPVKELGWIRYSPSYRSPSCQAMFDAIITLLNAWIRQKNAQSGGKKKTMLRFPGGERSVDRVPRTLVKVSRWAVDDTWTKDHPNEEAYMADDEEEDEGQGERAREQSAQPAPEANIDPSLIGPPSTEQAAGDIELPAL
ncbi:hypothetical protein PENSPDRAFT_739176 [Peniophora sp. CONT]|nr:hypothetical protein PENSPDRAFT_739176 [Peniophora sp. CONT]